MGNENSTSPELIQDEKHENGSVKITANGLQTDVKKEPNGEPPSLSLTSDSPEYVVIGSDTKPADAAAEPPADVQATPGVAGAAAEKPAEADVAVAVVQEVVKKKPEEKFSLFSKMFKKKDEAPPEDKAKAASSEDQTDGGAPPTEPQTEAADPQQGPQTLPDSPEPETARPESPEPESPEPDGPKEEEDEAPGREEGTSQPAESPEETDTQEKSVMNFFKTLVNTTKTSKKEAATPDAAKDQSQMESQPSAPTTVAQISDPPAPPKGMSVPPPPPPEPPRLEVKGEPSAKAAKPEEPKAAAKGGESSKGKSAKDALSKFFRPKTVKEALQPAEADVAAAPGVDLQEAAEELPEAEQSGTEVDLQGAAEELVHTVVGEVKKADPSKSDTLEAAAKPEATAPPQEEKKTAAKAPFLSLFKPKVLFDHVTTKVQAASSSGVGLLRRTTGLAAAAKPAGPTPQPAAAAEAAAAAAAAPAAKAKEEPKAAAAAAAKAPEAAVDNKAAPGAPGAPQAAEEAAKGPKKVEKRNSIHGFFKNLGQKRHSTDAGVQTEAATAEKAK